MSYALFGLLAILQALDVYTTRRILLAGGKELNPVGRWLISKLGLEAGLIAPKIAILVVCWFVLLPFPWVLAALCIFYVGVIAYNWKSL